MKTRYLPYATSSFSLAILFSLFLSGCATVDKITAPSLKGDPSTSSVVVVKCKSSWQGVLGIKESQDAVSGVILSVVSPQEVKQVNGRAAANLIIFSDVPPGEYNLASVATIRHTSNGGKWRQVYNVPGDDATKYVFTVKAGEPKYLGVVTIEETQTLKRSVAFGLKESSGAEKEAWEKFSSLYPQSAWTSAVQKRISELK